MGLSLHLILMSLSAGLAGNFQLGYLASVLTQPYVAIEQYINASWIERSGEPITRETLTLLMSILNITNPVAQIIGQLVALFICNRIGRKNTALVGCGIIFPGVLLSLFAKWLQPAFEVLFVGRILWSMADGILVVNQTIWLVEAAPAKYRGSVSSMQEVFAAFGALTTLAFGVPFSSDELWPLVFVFPLVINVFCIICFFIVPESPQYLLFQRKSPEQAKKAIAAYHGTSDVKRIEQQFDIVQNNGTSSNAESENKPKVNGMDIMFRPWKANDNVSKVLRRGAWIGVMVKIAFVFTGTRAVRSFSTYILKDMSGWSYLDARYASLAMGLLRLPLTFVPVFLVDRVGRRPLLIWSAALSVVFLTLTMICLLLGDAFKVGTLIGVTLLLSINVIGLGSLSRFYAAELVPRKILLKSVSVLAILEALVRIVPEFSFYPLSHSIGAYYLISFIVPTIIFLVMIWRYCPETKGRSVNDVLNEMAQKMGVDTTFVITDVKPKIETKEIKNPVPVGELRV